MLQFWIIFVLLIGTIVLSLYWITKYASDKSVSINDFRNIVITYSLKHDSYNVNSEFDDISKGIYTSTDFSSFFDPRLNLSNIIRQIKTGNDSHVGRTFKVKLKNGSKYLVKVDSVNDSKIVFDMQHSAFDDNGKIEKDRKGIATSQDGFIQKANEAIVKYSKNGAPTILFRVRIAGYERICKKYSSDIGMQIIQNASKIYSRRIKKSIVWRDTYNGAVYVFAPIQKDANITNYETIFTNELQNISVAGINFALNSIITASYVDESKFSEMQHRFNYLEMDAPRYTSYFRIYDHISDTPKYREYLENAIKIKEDISEERINLSFAQIYDLSKDDTFHYIVKSSTDGNIFEKISKQENFLEINGLRKEFEKTTIRKVMENIFSNESLKTKIFHVNALSSSVAQEGGIKIPVGYVDNISITITDWSYNDRAEVRKVIEFLKSNDVKIGFNYIYSFETLKNALTFEPDYIFVSKKLLKTSYENGTNKEQLRLINDICRSKNIMVVFEDIDTRLDVDLVLSVGGRFIQGEMITPYSPEVQYISFENEEELEKAKQYVFY